MQVSMVKSGAGLSLKAKLRLAGLATFIGLAITVAAGVIGLDQSGRGLAASALSAKAVVHAMKGDMMHDALRSDVLTSLLKGPMATAEETGTIHTDTMEHGAIFIGEIDALTELPLDPEILASVAELQPIIAKYTQKANNVVNGALKKFGGGDADGAEFQVLFAELEEKMGALDTQLEQLGAVASASAAATVAVSTQVMLVAAEISGLILLTSNFFLGRSITKPLIEVRNTIGGVAKETMGAGIDDGHQKGEDELTAIRRYMALVSARLREALTMEDSIRRAQAEQHSVVTALSVGLSQLSAGDVTHAITDPFLRNMKAYG